MVEFVRAVDLPAGPAGRFVDDDASVFEADIEALALDHSVALRVWTERPSSLRVQAAAEFDGREWAVLQWPEPRVPLARLSDAQGSAGWAA